MNDQRSLLHTPGVLAWLRLARIFQKVDRASAIHLASWGLSVAQFDVLAQVGAAEGITQQQLAGALLVTKGNISQLLRRMIADGLVRRVPQGRANRLYLTDKGRALFDQTVHAQEALIAGRFAALSAADQAELLRLLRTLDRVLS